MKKLNFISIFILFLSVSVFGQITKDTPPKGELYYVNTFVIDPVPTVYRGYSLNGSLINVEKYYTYPYGVTYGLTQIPVTFYNLDYSVYKNININIPTGAEFYQIYFATTKLFNNDDLIEFVYSYKLSGSNYYKLMNENNQIIYEFEPGEFPVAAMLTSDKKFKLLTAPQNGSYANYYSLGTTLPTGISPLSLAPAENIPYPNPAKQIIHLPYQLEQGKQASMKIFDVNGKQVTTKQIDPTFDKILLDVSSYQKGMYVYEVNGKRGKFLVE